MPRKKRTLLTVMHQSGFTQRSLAAKLGIHWSYLSHISNGRRVPSLSRSAQIAKALGLTLDEFRRLVKA